METFYWHTDDYHLNNTQTMQEYLEFHLPKDFEVTHEDGSYSEIQNKEGSRYGVHASGNRDSNNHKIEFKLLKEWES